MDAVWSALCFPVPVIDDMCSQVAIVVAGVVVEEAGVGEGMGEEVVVMIIMGGEEIDGESLSGLLL